MIHISGQSQITHIGSCCFVSFAETQTSLQATFADPFYWINMWHLYSNRLKVRHSGLINELIWTLSPMVDLVFWLQPGFKIYTALSAIKTRSSRNNHHNTVNWSPTDPRSVANRSSKWCFICQEPFAVWWQITNIFAWSLWLIWYMAVIEDLGECGRQNQSTALLGRESGLRVEGHFEVWWTVTCDMRDRRTVIRRNDTCV